MPHSLDDVIDGSLGWYWIQNDRTKITTNDAAWPGYLSRRSDGRVELTLLLANHPADAPISMEDGPPCEFIVGSTDNGGVFLDGARQNGSSRTYGGHKASTRRYDIEMVAVDVPYQVLQSGHTLELCVSWKGIESWTGLTSLDAKREYDDSGRIASVTLTLKRREPISIRLTDEIDLGLGSNWRVHGPDGARVVEAPSTFTLSGDLSLPDRINTAARIQDLISIAFQSRVTPSRATIDLSMGADASRHRFDFWNRGLMEPSPGVRRAEKMTEVPLFYLADLGNMEGISRWIDFCRDHPVIVRPVVATYHVGIVHTESMLLDIGGAIDTWRGVNARNPDRAWAKDKFQPRAVAGSIGPEFARWVGDVNKWSAYLWYHYNGLKHFIPDYQYDDAAVHWLALSGQCLLTAVALLEAANGNSEVTQRIMNSHRWNGRGRAVREWLSQQPDKSPPN